MSNSTMNVQSAGSISTGHRFPWFWKKADLDKVTKNGRKVFSCFSCGGGSSLGYKLAGFDVIGCCEIDPKMFKIYEQNNHPKYGYLMDIRDFLKVEDLPDELYDLDILDGSPPCSVFSMAGERDRGWNKEKQFREGQKEQRLDDLFFYFVDVVRKLRPKVAIAENVKGLITGKAKGYVNEICKAFNEAGYDVQIFLLNASRMGVPQNRERVFFIARRKDLELPAVRLNFNEKSITFGEVREEHGKKVGDDTIAKILLQYRKPTDRKLDHVSQRTRRKIAGFTHPINVDNEPVRTITAGGEGYRMCDGLLMTDRDYINCQTFPQDYDFMDQNVQYVCGMSVPPVMMANIATEVYKQLFIEKPNGE